MTIHLRAGALALTLAPARGGGIAAFTHAGEPIFLGRPDDSSPLGLASFPLLPFSNRIADGRFNAGARAVVLPRNHPTDHDSPHAIHGMAWQLPWTVVAADTQHCHMALDVPAGAWPWAWRGEQWFDLDPNGLRQRIALTNQGDTPMPAGIGAHPYFPRDPATVLSALHSGEWQTGADGLPVTLTTADRPRDWWQGAPIASRIVDTVYAGRVGEMTLCWPDRALAVTIAPSPSLGFSTIYVPDGEAYVCIEPVSHMTDAVNRPEPAAVTGLRWLAPGDTLAGSVDFRICPQTGRRIAQELPLPGCRRAAHDRWRARHR